MKSFRFVHAADLHLDTPFQGLAGVAPDEALLGKVRRSTTDAFLRLIEVCLQVEADFLVIAGDVFDAEDRSLRAMLTFRDGLVRLAERGIPTYVCHGNHDPLSGWSNAVKHHPLVTVFGTRMHAADFVRDGDRIARIAGTSYGLRAQSENPALQLGKIGKSDVYTIAVLHSSVGDHPDHGPYAPCSVDQLAHCPVDYVALGHIHQRAILHREPWIVYSGNIQGRHVGETGAKGCCIVDVDSTGKTMVEFHELDIVRWHQATLDVGGVESLDAVRDAITGRLLAMQKDSGERSIIVRLRIEGRTVLDHELRQPGTRDDLLSYIHDIYGTVEPFIWIESLGINTLPEADLAKRALADDFLGAVLRFAGEQLESGADPAVLHAPLAELFAHEASSRHLRPLDDVELKALVEEARLLCFDHLEGGE